MALLFTSFCVMPFQKKLFFAPTISIYLFSKLFCIQIHRIQEASNVSKLSLIAIHGKKNLKTLRFRLENTKVYFLFVNL